jgi:riboflavin kinase/FMN adenylyltransferase
MAPSPAHDIPIVPLAAVEPRSRAVAIGTFDGVHVGHRAAIAGADTVLTLEPHPRAVVDPELAPPLLTSLPERARRLAGLGVRELVVLPFDATMAAMTAEAFVDVVLVERLGARRVLVGESFRFGSHASGDPGLLRADPRFRTEVVPLLCVDGAPVSSTRVRHALAAGAVEEAASLLGSPHAVEGVVRTAADGFASVHAPGAAIPAPGRYACVVEDAAVVVEVAPRGGELVPAIAPAAAPAEGTRVRVEFLARMPRPARLPLVAATSPR